MERVKKKFLIGLFFLVLAGVVFRVKADELDDINRQLDDLNQKYSSSVNATKPLETTLAKLRKQLAGLISQVNKIEKEINQKEVDLQTAEKALVYQKVIFDQKVISYYKNIKNSPPSLLYLISGENLSDSLKSFFYQKKTIDEDKKTIFKIVAYMKKVEETKKELQSEQVRLAKIKEKVNNQSTFLNGEVSKAKNYQKDLQNQIAQLKARQRKLIAERLASLHISRSAATIGRCDNDLTNGRDPGFSPRFAVFTYGVPNRVGMNQWGAYGRAKAGQNVEQILRAYYNNFELKKDYNRGININVDGYGTFNIEDYVKRIYEVPDSWGNDGFEALKAQAVAARSYALAYTNNGKGSICPTEHCQVFKKDPKGGNWERAVNDTAGWVMVHNGSPIKAWFSSTHGGYIFKTGEIGWSDTAWTKHGHDFDGSVNSFSDLKNKAFDRDSPWFTCDWGWRSQYNKTAWLKPAELADIVNSLMLSSKDPATGAHLYQTDKPHPYGGEIWDENRVKQELKNRGITPFNTINSAQVSVDFNYGKTNQVTITGDGGTKSFSAADFKKQFNLRAPANIQIVGPLYNIEKR